MTDKSYNSSGYYARNASSGDSAQNASSGDYARNASSGDYAQNASSGDSAQNASSGDYARNETTGEDSINADIGFCSITKSKKGNWITLAEYTKNSNNKIVPLLVKTEQVDGERIKEDVFYALKFGKFCEVIEADGIRFAITAKKGSVYYGGILEEFEKSVLIHKDGFWSHGKTLKDARESLKKKQ